MLGFDFTSSSNYYSNLKINWYSCQIQGVEVSFMPTIPTTPKKQKHKHRKRKNRLRQPMDIGTPKVPLSNNWHQQRHELLKDWEDAT